MPGTQRPPTTQPLHAQTQTLRRAHGPVPDAFGPTSAMARSEFAG